MQSSNSITVLEHSNHPYHASRVEVWYGGGGGIPWRCGAAISGLCGPRGSPDDYGRTRVKPVMVVGSPQEIALLRTGSPEAVTRLRLPWNVACGFPALRSSEVGSQHSDSLQLPVREIELWSQQRRLRLDLIEHCPSNAALAAPATKHLVPIALHGSVYPVQARKFPAMPK
jgi:hypothetical protein